ncbi:MAG TPA: chaperonin GroEL [Clostridia bacterium]
MRIKTDIIQKEEAQDAIYKGAEIVSSAVGSTLGPSGKNVAIAYSNEYGIHMRIVVKDGVTVARSIDLDDEFANMGAQIIKEASWKTVQAVGDGTTVSSILSFALYKQIFKLSRAGYDPILLRKEVEKAVDKVIAEIDKIAIPVKTLEQKKQIANISANDEELGELIAKTIQDMGPNGLILVEESTFPVTKVEKTEGFQFDKGWAAPEFMTNPNRLEATVENPYILITDEYVNDLKQIEDLLNELAQKRKKLVFIASNFSLIVAGNMADNKNRGVLPSLLIEAPGMGQNQKNTLSDIAVLTGGTFFSQSTGRSLKDATLEDLGQAEYVKSTRTETLISGGKGQKEVVTSRIAEIEKMLDSEEQEFDKEKLKERLARFTSGIAVIKVGGATETEMKERLERVKDSVQATKAAVATGIVPGGEVIYLVIRETLSTKNIAENIVYQALFEPFRILLTNAGLDAGEWYEKLKSSPKHAGVDVTKPAIVDMVKEGIIDPSEVSREALRNACSTAIANSSIGFIIIQKNTEKDTKR